MCDVPSRVVILAVHFTEPCDVDGRCADCGCVLFGEAGVLVEQQGCGHVSAYCGDCATWRFLRADSELHTTDTQAFLDWRFSVEASMN
jgi:hypothetical protein